MTIKTVKIRWNRLFMVLTLISVIVFGSAFFRLNGERVLHADGKASFLRSDAQLSVQEQQIASHVRFLSAFGWEICSEPVDISDVVIPEVFDSVFDAYNDLQLAQGYDFSVFKGKQLEKYVYRILNYPGRETDETVCADVYVYRGKIVGGDVCSVRIDGFMQGFQRETDGKDQTG